MVIIKTKIVMFFMIHGLYANRS